MADNVTITPGVGATVAADDIGGALYQRVKPALGADGAATDLNYGQAAMGASVPVVVASDQTAVPVSGTFYQATQPVSVASGQQVDGHSATIGATTDAAVVTDANGTLGGKLRGLVKWAFERMPAALGQAAMAASMPVAIANNQSAVAVTPGAQEVHLGEVGGNATVVAVTPTITAGAYTAGDIVGGIQTIANAARASAKEVVLQSLVITDLAALTQAFTIWFFNANPSNGTYTDNLALDIHDTDMGMCIGFVTVAATDYASAADNSVAVIRNIGLVLKAAATSIFAIAQATGTAPTYVSTGDLTFKYGLLRD